MVGCCRPRVLSGRPGCHHQTFADLVVALTGHQDEASPVSTQAHFATLRLCHGDTSGALARRNDGRRAHRRQGPIGANRVLRHATH